ncbi:MAG: ATP-binding protein [Nitrospirota bacterium]
MRQSYSFSTNRQLCIKYWGKKISSFTKKSSEDVLGKKYYEIFPRIFVDNNDALSVVFKTKNKLILKGYYFNCLNGKTKADITISPRKTSNGRISSINVTISPLSSCTVAEELYKCQRLIDIGKTASTLAHGVRSPLNAIKGAVVYLREKYAKESTLIEFTKIMEEEIARLDHFISKFLSSSISNAAPSLINVNTLLEKINIMTSLQAHSLNINVSRELGNIPGITINPFQLEQAILNVVNNAIESMPSGGELVIRTFSEKRSRRDFVVIEVSDTGAGISKKGIFKLEEKPFEDTGRGFGMFITREIIRYYSGHLEIKSEKNVGTSVKLYLPVAKHLPVK